MVTENQALPKLVDRDGLIFELIFRYPHDHQRELVERSEIVPEPDKETIRRYDMQFPLHTLLYFYSCREKGKIKGSPTFAQTVELLDLTDDQKKIIKLLPEEELHIASCVLAKLAWDGHQFDLSCYTEREREQIEVRFTFEVANRIQNQTLLFEHGGTFPIISPLVS